MDCDEGNRYDMQFLRLKEYVMGDGIERSQVSGISHAVCVQDVRQLLVGEVDQRKVEAYHRAAIGNMGWSLAKTEEILNTRLNAEIRENLTDRLWY
jgi:hypothetical protein|tara:strand:+ start:679 stop:966 length:288 start_codon:yes stop_codon:yes gene_type:complete